MRRRARGVALALILAGAPALGGCYGRFPLTKAVYHFNGDVTDDELLQSLLFWLFIILPVYNLAMLGDAIIFNLIEFWTGETLDISAVDRQGDVTVTLAPAATEGQAWLTVTRDGEPPVRTRLVRTEVGTIEARSEEGALTGRLMMADDGSILLADAEGKIMRRVARPASAFRP